MTATIVLASIALFVLVAILLLSLNILSLWWWPIKAAATIVTLGATALVYYAFVNVIGWPSTDAMPARFSLLHTRIIEPDRMTGAPGHIYLWAEEIDGNQIVIGRPRAYEVPYEVEMATDVATAQNMLDEGTEVMGELAATTTEQGERQAGQEEREDGRLQNQALERRQIASDGEGLERVGDPAVISFSEMAPVTLPDKGPVQVIAQ